MLCLSCCLSWPIFRSFSHDLIRGGAILRPQPLRFYALDPTVLVALLLRVFCVHRRFIRVRRLLARRVPAKSVCHKSDKCINIYIYYIKL